MNGQVDDSLRALLEVRIRKSRVDEPVAMTVWIDTAFDGFFVFPRTAIKELELQQESTTDAILADGTCVTLESYTCFVEWFGKIVAAQVVANEGRLPLLGTELMANHRLVIDYADRLVSIT